MGFNPNSVNGSHLAFTFASPVSQVICRLQPGFTISEITVAIDVPFDDPSAVISVGTSANPSLFLGPEDSDLGVTGQYASSLVYMMVVSDYLILTINASASTMGAGVLYYQLRPA